MGPPIDAGMAPSFLERGKTSGRHAVPEAEWDTLINYLNQRYGAAAVVDANPVAVEPGASAVGGGGDVDRSRPIGQGETGPRLSPG